jgi:DNA-binding NarL/FixJ family response regulator
MVRVFLVEDSPTVSARLEAMLGAIAGVTHVGRAVAAEEATRTILADRPDAVVLDLKLASGSGFDVLRAVQEQAPEIDVYVLSNLTGEPYRRRAALLGAREFFDKTTEFERVQDLLAVRAAQIQD